MIRFIRSWWPTFWYPASVLALIPINIETTTAYQWSGDSGWQGIPDLSILYGIIGAMAWTGHLIIGSSKYGRKFRSLRSYKVVAETQNSVLWVYTKGRYNTRRSFTESETDEAIEYAAELRQEENDRKNHRSGLGKTAKVINKAS